MATKKIEILDPKKWQGMGLYNSLSGNREDVVPYKVIDVTSYCTQVKETEQILIRYANLGEKHNIFQLAEMYEKGKDIGAYTHWPLHFGDKLLTEQAFTGRCRILGADPAELLKIILDNQEL